MCCSGTASLKQIYFLGAVRKVSNKNTLSGETFALLKTVCYQCLNFVPRVTLFYYKLLIGPQPTFLECIVNLL